MFFGNSPGHGVHSTTVSSLNQSINIAQLFLSQLGAHVLFNQSDCFNLHEIKPEIKRI